MKKKIFCSMRSHKEVYKSFTVLVSKNEINNLRISRSCIHIIYNSNVPVEFITKFKCEEYLKVL